MTSVTPQTIRCIPSTHTFNSIVADPSVTWGPRGYLAGRYVGQFRGKVPHVLAPTFASRFLPLHSGDSGSGKIPELALILPVFPGFLPIHCTTVDVVIILTGTRTHTHRGTGTHTHTLNTLAPAMDHFLGIIMPGHRKRDSSTSQLLLNSTFPLVEKYLWKKAKVISYSLRYRYV